MIKYKLFKYSFFRYCVYNLLCFSIFIWLPILFYIILILHITLRIQGIVQINEIVKPWLNNFKDYSVLFQYIDTTGKILIIFFAILIVIAYLFMNKLILKKILFNKYNNITIQIRVKTISLIDIILFALINFTFLATGTISLFFYKKLNNINYVNYLYLLNAINYIISWILTYIPLNKFLEHYTIIKFKPLRNKLEFCIIRIIFFL